MCIVEFNIYTKFCCFCVSFFVSVSFIFIFSLLDMYMYSICTNFTV